MTITDDQRAGWLSAATARPPKATCARCAPALFFVCLDCQEEEVRRDRVLREAVPALLDEADRLRGALMKISAIRDGIVGLQGFNFSEHAYPLVAVLGEAGFPGVGYEIASKNLGTLIEQRDRAEAELERVRPVYELVVSWRKLWSAHESGVRTGDINGIVEEIIRAVDAANAKEHGR